MHYLISKHVQSKRVDVFYATILLVCVLMLLDLMPIAKLLLEGY
jgi:hypothetical protein